MLFYICLFACLYMLFGSLENSNGEAVTGLWSHFYFSTVTFTTLGYGNIVPSNTVGEVIASIEVIIGFVAFALLIGIASALVELDKAVDDFEINDVIANLIDQMALSK